MKLYHNYKNNYKKALNKTKNMHKLQKISNNKLMQIMKKKMKKIKFNVHIQIN